MPIKKEKNMKSRNIVFFLLLSVLCALVLASCDIEYENGGNGTTAYETTSKTKPETKPVTKPETKPVTEPETKPETSGQTTTQKISIISLTESVKPNNKASISIKGNPNTTYSISVYYSSGPSTAAGLESKKSDSKGKVSWTWKVGGKTKAGTYRIVITGGGETFTTYFTVT